MTRRSYFVTRVSFRTQPLHGDIYKTKEPVRFSRLTGHLFIIDCLNAAHKMGDVILIDGPTHNRRLGDIARLLPCQTGLNFIHDQLHRHRLPTVHPRPTDDLGFGVPVNRGGHFFGQPSDIVELGDDDELCFATELPQFLRRTLINPILIPFSAQIRTASLD